MKFGHFYLYLAISFYWFWQGQLWIPGPLYIIEIMDFHYIYTCLKNRV